MPMYFINATERREQALQSAGISFETFKIGNQNGFLISEEDHSNTLRVLRIQVIEESGTDYDGIVRLSVRSLPKARPVSGDTSVVVERWRGRGENLHESEIFLKITEELKDIFGVKKINLLLDYDILKPCPRDNQDEFTIFLWNSVNGQVCGSCASPETVWGIRLGERGAWRMWHPQGYRGAVAINDDQTKVAELIGNNLYVFLPIHSAKAEEGPEIYQRLLVETLRIYRPSQETESFLERLEVEREARVLAAEVARIEKIRAEGALRRDASREAYIGACGGRFERTLEQTRKSIRDGESEAATLQNELIACIRRTKGQQRKLIQMEAVRDGDRSEYGLEFDKLFIIPHVIDVRLDLGKIVVYTDKLYCKDPSTDKVHEIGAFSITIGTNGGLHFHNETRQIKIDGTPFDAPHVQNGKPCLGTLGEIIPQLSGNYEFAALIMVAIQYIESVNIEDQWGQGIKLWPVVA